MRVLRQTRVRAPVAPVAPVCNYGECPVCLEEMHTIVYPFNCTDVRHGLCRSCDRKMFTRHDDRCPLCRASRSRDNIATHGYRPRNVPVHERTENFLGAVDLAPSVEPPVVFNVGPSSLDWPTVSFIARPAEPPNPANPANPANPLDPLNPANSVFDNLITNALNEDSETQMLIAGLRDPQSMSLQAWRLQQAARRQHFARRNRPLSV